MYTCQQGTGTGLVDVATIHSIPVAMASGGCEHAVGRQVVYELTAAVNRYAPGFVNNGLRTGAWAARHN